MKFIATLKVLRLVVVMSAAGLLSACSLTGDAMHPAKVTASMLDGKALVIGSMLSQDDGFYDALVVWNMITDEKYFILDATPVPLSGNKGIELSVFAIVLDPGSYVFSHDQTESPGMRTWVGNEGFTRNPLQSGDFKYAGRFVCRPKVHGCNWVRVKEAEQDIPIIRAINPNLPWGRFQHNVTHEPETKAAQ